MDDSDTIKVDPSTPPTVSGSINAMCQEGSYASLSLGDNSVPEIDHTLTHSSSIPSKETLHLRGDYGSTAVDATSSGILKGDPHYSSQVQGKRKFTHTKSISDECQNAGIPEWKKTKLTEDVPQGSDSPVEGNVLAAGFQNTSVKESTQNAHFGSSSEQVMLASAALVLEKPSNEQLGSIGSMYPEFSGSIQQLGSVALSSTVNGTMLCGEPRTSNETLDSAAATTSENQVTTYQINVVLDNGTYTKEDKKIEEMGRFCGPLQDFGSETRHEKLAPDVSLSSVEEKGGRVRLRAQAARLGREIEKQDVKSSSVADFASYGVQRLLFGNGSRDDGDNQPPSLPANEMTSSRRQGQNQLQASHTTPNLPLDSYSHSETHFYSQLTTIIAAALAEHPQSPSIVKHLVKYLDQLKENVKLHDIPADTLNQLDGLLIKFISDKKFQKSTLAYFLELTKSLEKGTDAHKTPTHFDLKDSTQTQVIKEYQRLQRKLFESRAQLKRLLDERNYFQSIAISVPGPIRNLSANATAKMDAVPDFICERCGAGNTTWLGEEEAGGFLDRALRLTCGVCGFEAPVNSRVADTILPPLNSATTDRTPDKRDKAPYHAQDQEALREEVEKLRKALADIQEKHREEISKIRAELEESQAAKEQVEFEYQDLLRKVNRFKSALGERPPADPSKHQRIGSVMTENELEVARLANHPHKLCRLHGHPDEKLVGSDVAGFKGRPDAFDKTGQRLLLKFHYLQFMKLPNGEPALTLEAARTTIRQKKSNSEPQVLEAERNELSPRGEMTQADPGPWIGTYGQQGTYGQPYVVSAPYAPVQGHPVQGYPPPLSPAFMPPAAHPPPLAPYPLGQQYHLGQSFLPQPDQPGHPYQQPSQEFGGTTAAPPAATRGNFGAFRWQPPYKPKPDHPSLTSPTVAPTSANNNTTEISDFTSIQTPLSTPTKVTKSTPSNVSIQKSKSTPIGKRPAKSVAQRAKDVRRQKNLKTDTKSSLAAGMTMTNETSRIVTGGRKRPWEPGYVAPTMPSYNKELIVISDDESDESDDARSQISNVEGEHNTEMMDAEELETDLFAESEETATAEEEDEVDARSGTANITGEQDREIDLDELEVDMLAEFEKIYEEVEEEADAQSRISDIGGEQDGERFLNELENDILAEIERMAEEEKAEAGEEEGDEAEEEKEGKAGEEEEVGSRIEVESVESEEE